MYLIRDVFKAKPGKAKNLVEIFKNVSPVMMKMGAKGTRVMTDVVSDYWTVIWEFEMENMQDYFSSLENRDPEMKAEIARIMEGYMDLVMEGHREIFRIH